MFKEAKTLKNAATEPKGKKKERDLIPMLGCEQLAHLDAVIKAATAAKETIQERLSEKVREIFMGRIEKADGKQPESFYMTEGLAEVNCQLRKRGANSALNDEEREILDKSKIEYQKEVITPQLFAINPVYAADNKMLEKVEKALAKLGLPEDFIVMQEEKHKYVVDEDCLTKTFKSKNVDLIRISTTLAFKPTLKELRPHDLAATVEEILGIEKEEEKEKATPAPKAKAAKK